MSNLKIADLYDLQETIAAELFEGLTYPWEALPKIGDFIRKLGASLPEEEYEKVGEDVWIAKDATVYSSAYIHGPAIIGKGAEVRHCAFIRGNALVERALWWAIPRSLRTWCCSTKCRFPTIIM